MSAPPPDAHIAFLRLLADLRKDPSSIADRGPEAIDALCFLLLEVERLRYTIADLQGKTV